MSVTANENIKSVKSIDLRKSLIQTIYDIMKAHSGKIKVESKKGEGSEFFIELLIA
jgi:light-regulated signal transduction histidine kinase (bacteriophytochrome)